MTIKNKGFTLVELVVVTALFGILAVVASNFLVATFSSSNRIAIENEVRQNATLVMEDMENEIRKASCVYFSGSTLTLSDSTEGLKGTCQVGNKVIFSVDSLGKLSRNGSNLSSEKVAFVLCSDDSACSSVEAASCDPGLAVTSVDGVFPTAGAVDITLSARQKNATARVDSCARVTLSETVTPRNSGN